MEEKERYECKYNEKLMKHYTFDNENKEELGYKGVVRVLNQQDARIKELEEENKFLEKRNEKLIIDRRDLCLERNDIAEENQQLKQAQKQLAIEELKKQLKEKENEIQTKNTINNLYKATLSLRDNDFKDLVYENNLLKQQLKSQPAEIVEKIRKSIHYYPIALLDSDKEPRIKTLGISKEVLDNLLKKYQK